MRQIQDRWKFDAKNNNPSLVEVQEKLYSSFKYSAEQLTDFSNYTQSLIPAFFSKKCNTYCLNSQDNLKCVEACFNKFKSSVDVYNRVNDQFEENFENFQKSGKNIFQD